MTKWPDRPHWVFEGHYLGSDDHGDWVGFPAGTRCARPGAEFLAPYDHVTVVPATEHHWVATFWAAGDTRVYVDIATPPVWDGPVVGSVDLDLDVVRGRTGRVWIDDEDEFADHRVRFAYPESLVRHALTACGSVEAALRAGEAPYDGTHLAWLDLVAGLPAV